LGVDAFSSIGNRDLVENGRLIIAFQIAWTLRQVTFTVCFWKRVAKEILCHAGKSFTKGLVRGEVKIR
jgi:hypothetical protein